MKYLMILILLFFVSGIMAQTSAPGQAFEVVGVCEVLSNRKAYNGKWVILVGRWAATDEGFWLKNDCRDQIKTGKYIWSNLIYLEYDPSAPSAFTKGSELADPRIKKKVDEFRNGSKSSDKKTDWAVVYGKIETQEELPVVFALDDSTMPAGYGHLNAAPAQIIYKRKDLKIFSDK